MRLKASLTALFLFLCASSVIGDQAKPPFYMIPWGKIQNGDIIFRQGMSPISLAIMASSSLISQSTPSWSHVGMIVMHDGKLMVLHACPPDNPGEFSGVRYESIKEFTSHSVSVGVYRLKNASRHQLMLMVKESKTMLHRPFDAHLDINSDKSIFCTELIDDAMKMSSISTKGIVFHDIRIPTLGYRKMITPYALSNWHGLERINNN